MGYYFWQVVAAMALRPGSTAGLWNRPGTSPIPLSTRRELPDGFEANSTSTPTTKSLGAFGQLDWKIAESLTVTGGLRYTSEKKSGAYNQWWVAGTDLSLVSDATVGAGSDPPRPVQSDHQLFDQVHRQQRIGADLAQLEDRARCADLWQLFAR